MSTFGLTWLALTLALPPTASGDTVSECSRLLTNLNQSIQRNYAGFRLEVTGSRHAAFNRELARLGARAATARGEDCFPLLHDLVTFFADPHLFIYQQTYLDSAGTARRMAIRPTLVRHEEIDGTAPRARLTALGMTDPIVGIWRDGAMRMAILPDSGREGHFLAIVLTSDTSGWTPGDVRAVLARRGDSYVGRLTERNLAERWVEVTIHRRVILRFSPGIWGKEFPVAAPDRGTVDSIDAHRATLVWRGKTPVISIPSHDPSHRAALDSILQTHRSELATAARLIVDVRGNEGGSSWVTDSLVALLGSADRSSPVPEDDPHMLSSADQISYLKQAWQNVVADSSAAADLIARMEANPGQLIRIQASNAKATATVADHRNHPGRIGILIDRGTVSAGEVFVLEAMRRSRVVTFGEATAGALDYQSVAIVSIGDPERRWYLGYPTIAARPDLPRGGIRGKGILPNVRVDWRRVADPIGLVDRELSRSQ